MMGQIMSSKAAAETCILEVWSILASSYLSGVVNTVFGTLGAQ